MKKVWIKFVVLISLGAIGLVVYFSLLKKGSAPLKAQTIDEMLALPDEEIDVGLGALLIGKEYDPDLDVRRYLKKLDKMADELRSRISDEAQPREIIAVIGRYVFQELGYVVPKEEGQNAGDNFLHVLLERGEGECSRLSTLYVALAERLGLPLFGVSAPRHLFVRYVRGGTRINIETTLKGVSPPDSYYVARYHVPDTPAAARFYMASLSKRDFLAALLSNLAAAQLQEGNLKEALDVCWKSLAVCPNDPQAWGNLGAAYLARGEATEAVVAIRKALEINPVEPILWNNLGNAYTRQDRMDEAILAYSTARQLDPHYAEAWDNLGTAYFKLRKIEEAVAACEKAVSINPNDAKLWFNLSLAYLEQRKPEQALRAAKEAVAVNPDHGKAWYNIGQAHLELGDPDRAIPACRKALTINSGFAEAWDLLGRAHAEQGRFDEAIASHEKSIAIAPDVGETWNNLAAAYYLKGDYPFAWSCVHKCRELGHSVNAKLLRALQAKMTDPGG